MVPEREELDDGVVKLYIGRQIDEGFGIEMKEQAKGIEKNWRENTEILEILIYRRIRKLIKTYKKGTKYRQL